MGSPLYKLCTKPQFQLGNEGVGPRWVTVKISRTWINRESGDIRKGGGGMELKGRKGN